MKMNLSTLPELQPLSDQWPAIRDALQRRRHRRRLALLGTGMAAVLSLGVGWNLWQVNEPVVSGGSGDDPLVQQPVPALASPEDVLTGQADDTLSTSAGGSETLRLADAVALSRRLEYAVRDARGAHLTVNGKALMAQTEIEDLVAHVDNALMIRPDDAGLWRQRVVLMADLLTLYQQPEVAAELVAL